MDLEQPSELVREALTVVAAWGDDSGRRKAWAEHFARHLSVDALTDRELNELARAVGGEPQVALRWLDRAREHALDFATTSRDQGGHFINALEQLARLAPRLDLGP